MVPDREFVQQLAGRVNRVLNDGRPKGDKLGFALLVFPPAHTAACVSNITDMVELSSLLRETSDHLLVHSSGEGNA